jgi:hypothetical protein
MGNPAPLVAFGDYGCLLGGGGYGERSRREKESETFYSCTMN